MEKVDVMKNRSKSINLTTDDKPKFRKENSREKKKSENEESEKKGNRRNGVGRN